MVLDRSNRSDSSGALVKRPVHADEVAETRFGIRRRWILALVLLIAAGLAWDVASTGMQLRKDVLGAQQALVSALGDASLGDPEGAMTRLAAASGFITEAEQRSERPSWRLVRGIPWAGRTLRIVDATVALSDHAIGVAQSAIGALRPLLGSQQRPLLATHTVDLPLIELVSDQLAAIEVNQLRAAVERLATARTGGVASSVVHTRDVLIEQVLRSMDSLDAAADLLSVLPEFLGTSGRRNYLLAVQNPAELRGTGGLLGYLTVLTIDGGSITIGSPERPATLQRLLADGPDGSPPATSGVAVTPEFADRYQPAGADRFVVNVNVDPDLPMTSEVLLQMAEAALSERLDGVVLLDPLALDRMLGVVGAVEVAAPPGSSIAERFGPGQLAQAILIDEYQQIGGLNRLRKQWLNDVAAASLSAFLDRRWEPAELIDVMAVNFGERRIQLFSRDQSEQDAFERLGVTGSLRAIDGIDLIAVTANNVAPNKADAHVAHRQSLDVRLFESPDGGISRAADLRVAVQNPLPAVGMDPYIIGSSPVSGRMEPGGESGLSRTWFSVWVPPDVRFLETRNSDNVQTDGTPHTIHEASVVDHILEVSSRSEGAFQASWNGPVLTPSGHDPHRYVLHWRRQPKAMPDRLAIVLTIPAGFEVVGSDLRGGGTGLGFGPDGAPGPRLQLTVNQGQLSVQGDATRDVWLSVTFQRAS